MSESETQDPAVRPLVPDGPGWWLLYCGGLPETQTLRTVYVDEQLRWTMPGGHGSGRVDAIPELWKWRGPCLSLADVEAARREERERCVQMVIRRADLAADNRWSMRLKVSHVSHAIDREDELRRLAAEMRGAK